MSRNFPLVSIIIPCYNHENYIQDTIKSVIAQDYKNIELIIVDDGSNDGSVLKITELISACEERFHKFEFKTQENAGLSVTLNRALGWCKGEFLACLASDDVIQPHKTSTQVKYLLNHSKAVGVFGNIDLLHSDGKITSIFKDANEFSFNDIFLHKHYLPAPTQMLRLDAVKNKGGFLEGNIIEDWSMWLSLTAEGAQLDLISDTLALYRQHDSNTSSQFDRMQKARIEVLKIYKDKELYQEAILRTFQVAANDYITEDSIKSAYLLNKIELLTQ